MRLVPAIARTLALATLTPAIASAQRPAPNVPVTRRATVVDTIHGDVIPDDYRWLESQRSDDVKGWIAAQRRHADAVIGATPSRARFAKRLRELMGEPTVSAPTRSGEWEYFTQRRVGEEVASIRRRRAAGTPSPIDPAGTYETVLDPTTIRADGTTSVAIEGISGDGTRLLYSVRDGGADEISIRVRDLASKRDLPDSLPWQLYASVAWEPDGKSFTYVHRSRTVGPRLKRHVLGVDVASDAVLFGDGYAPTAFLSASSVDGGKKRLVTIGHGWARNEIWLVDATTNVATPIVRDVQGHFAAQWVDGAIWMRTDLDAPRGRLVVVDPAKPEPANWRTILPQSDIEVLDSWTRIDGRLVATYLRDAGHRLRVFTMEGAPLGHIAVPEHASATIRSAGTGRALLTVTTLAQPPVTYALDLTKDAAPSGRESADELRARHLGASRTVWEAMRTPFDTTMVVIRQVPYTSKDGSRGLIWILHQRGARPTRETPALLHGYGGFALSLAPRFDSRAAAWVERGGIYAQATLRGGNEFGEEWHKGGMLGNKQHVFDDFQAAAQALIDSGFTSSAHLAIRGVSNGGLLMGSMITQRPDLVRAAFVGRPDLDIVRFPQFNTANNAPALLEYGDASKPEEYKAIRAFSPYQNIRDGVPYPAVMFDVGYWDTRVPPWQARKMAARLQAASVSGLPIIFYEDPRSGHAGGRSWSDGVEMASRELEFLWRAVAGGGE